MSDIESIPPVPSASPRPRRKRRILVVAACLALLLAAAVVGLYFWISSANFEALMRERIVNLLEQDTGARVEIAAFHWRPLNLEADAEGVVLHGTEDAGDAPYAQVDSLRVGISLLGIWSPRILLRDLEIARPSFHLIIYPDGSTNQPHPKKPLQPKKSGIETLFDLQAGHVAVEDGVFQFENRSIEFDFQNRFTAFNFDARNVNVRMSYVPALLPRDESYHVEASASDLKFSRNHVKPSSGSIQATLDLTRNALYVRSLKLTSAAQTVRGRTVPEHTLDVSGTLQNFAKPHWQGKTLGDFDMRLLDPITGFPFAPEGIVHFDLDASGEAGEFRVDGSMHMEDITYSGTGVNVTGVRLDSHVHADGRRLLISSIVARFRQGGQIDGELSLSPWLPPLPGEAKLERTGIGGVRATGPHNRNIPVHGPPPDVPINGKVTAQIRNMSLDELLDAVGQPPFQRLGLATVLSGPVIATWSNGEPNTTVVSATLTSQAPSKPAFGEVPTNAEMDGTYEQRSGAVDLRKLEVHTPSSEVDAHGLLGVFPLSRSSGLTVDLHSTNLNDFDSVLRDLGLNRNGKSGTAALPITLNGQGDFNGSWTGSLVDPHLAGNLKATQISVEMPNGSQDAQQNSASPPVVQWDSIEATGSYAAERIAIDHALLHHGEAEITLGGSLDANPMEIRQSRPAFDATSLLHVHVRAAKVPLDDLLPLIGQKIPLTGTLDTQFQADGPVRALGGSGSAELSAGAVYGEPVNHLRAQGTLVNNVLKLTALTASSPAGALNAEGSYDFNSKRYQVDARGASIDITQIDAVRRQGTELTGKLGFTVTGAGTLDDPQLEAHASLNNFTVSGESLGALIFTAHAANRSVSYDATTGIEGTTIELHGKTALRDNYDTQAELDFSRFNIGALLKSAHIPGLVGESSLAGTVNLEGPLEHLDAMHGDARLEELAVTVDGVHLASQGGLHATLANARITLDPLHVTGEQTDLHAQGTLELKGDRQLNLAANGSINLKLAEVFDTDLTAGGTSTFQIEAHGPLKDPGFQGRIDFQNGALSLEDIPNGLSQLHGTLEFNQNRLEVRSLTAMSGGGQLSVAGYLAYQHGLFADLSVTGKSVRIRYPAGVSSIADTTLHLQGTQNNLLLSGDVLITRFSVSPDLDLAALAAQANTVQTIAPPDAPSNHIRLDVHIASSPQLNFQNAFAKLAGDVDLHLRGTVASPSLLGRISITEGNAMLAGTRYDLQRGDILFTNPVRIEPTIDLNATARVEDYDITLGLHGTPDKLTVTYRSDPPLPEADVVALLALGRTESQQRIYTQQQEQTGSNPTTDALLGGALNATVSSRVQRLFGAGSVKVDPNYLGAFGNSTSRIIVEEQLGRSVTLTYATNVDTTGQQLIQAEVAINRHVSLLVARDESGVFSMVVKATRRYR